MKTNDTTNDALEPDRFDPDELFEKDELVDPDKLLEKAEFFFDSDELFENTPLTEPTESPASDEPDWRVDCSLRPSEGRPSVAAVTRQAAASARRYALRIEMLSEEVWANGQTIAERQDLLHGRLQQATRLVGAAADLIDATTILQTLHHAAHADPVASEILLRGRHGDTPTA